MVGSGVGILKRCIHTLLRVYPNTPTRKVDVAYLLCYLFPGSLDG